MVKPVILLSAGGTGGHLFPAQALAFELAERGWEIHLATDQRADRFSAEFPAKEIHIIPSATPSGKNPLRMVMALLTLIRGGMRCRALMRRLQPEAVVGFGGYPTVPPLFVASWMKIPTIIHEANAVLGRANRFLSGSVKAVATGFALEDENSAEPGNSVVTGNPVRPSVRTAALQPYENREMGDKFRLLVFGGSQGAQFFSQILPQAIALLPGEIIDRLEIVQQARAEDETDLHQAYKAHGVSAEIAPFFAQMAEKIASAHLVISRAGASTLSEIAIIGRPAILVPYPFALDHDQAANASSIAQTGGATLHRQQDLSGEKLAALILDAINDPQGLAKSAENAKKAAKPEAASILADLVEHMAAGGTAKTIQEFSR